MIVRRFLEWTQSAQASGRAEAASALARAWLYSDLQPAQRDEALAALTFLLDDSAPVVRRALAEAFASASDAPAHIVLALSHDQSDIAAIVLARSPTLRDADLIDAVAIGDQAQHVAIACRAELSPGVCGALAEISDVGGLIALLRNRSAAIPEFAFRRMIERRGGNAELREAILARNDLPAGVRHMLVVAVSDALSQFVQDCAWLQPERSRRVVSEAREAAAVSIAVETNECVALVQHLCDTQQLTGGLLLRALLSGRIALLEAALSELTGQPVARVAAILCDRRGASFAALYRKAGLPDGLYAAFGAALAAWRDSSVQDDDDRGAALSRRIIERTLTAVAAAPGDDDGRLFALLRRYEAEAARDEARHFIHGLMADPTDDLEAEIRRLVDEQTALAA